MDKSQMLSSLDALVVERLFGSRPWFADTETGAAVNTALIHLGLVEQVPGQPCTWRYTSLGDELQVALRSAFMGLCDESEAIFILEIYGLVEEADRDYLFCLLEIGAADFDIMFRRWIQSAYISYFHPSRRTN
jgi:hypothetical protein